jgi:hypothetical protein
MATATVAELVDWLRQSAGPETFSGDAYQDAAMGQNRTTDRLGELARLYTSWWDSGRIPPKIKLERAALAVAVEGLRLALAVTGPTDFEDRLLTTLRGQMAEAARLGRQPQD